MKKNSQRKPKPRLPQRLGPAVPGGQEEAEGGRSHEHSHAHSHSHGHAREERKMGIATGTHADVFDEAAEQRHNKWIAIFISILAVLIAFAETGNTDMLKEAQHAGNQANDSYAFYQAKYIRQSQLRLGSDQLEAVGLQTPNLQENARKFIDSKKTEYDKETNRLEFNRRNGKRELLARAETCENNRREALAKQPYFDYSRAILQIAIVLASASIVTGAMFLVWVSGLVGVLGVLLFLNGHFLFVGEPHQKFDKYEALQKSMTYMHRWEAGKIAKCPLE
jgi:hypothetical protein